MLLALLGSLAVSAVAAHPATERVAPGLDLCAEPAEAGRLSRGLVSAPALLFSERGVRVRVAEVGDALVSSAGGRPVSLEAARAFVQGLSRCLYLELFDEVRWWFAAHASAFAPAARAEVDAFLHRQGPETLHADPVTGVDPRLRAGEPPLPVAWMRTRYHKRRGALFAGAPSFDESLQGRLGDCYFLSAVASLLERHSDFLSRALHEEPGGTIAGTFYARADWRAPPVPVRVSVDELLPLRGGALVGCSDRNPRTLWPPLLEKLWAAFKGGYEFTSGGVPADAFAALTGATASALPVFRDSAPGAVFAFIRAHELRGDAMTADTYGIDAHGHADPAVDYRSPWLARDHSYSLLGTRVDGGLRFIRLRNPWGYLEADGRSRRDLPPGDDGSFELSLAGFIREFAEVDAAAIPAANPARAQAAPSGRAQDRRALGAR